MDYQNILAKEIAKIMNKEPEAIISLFEAPKEEKFGDYALPCFSFAKEKKKSPQEIANEITEILIGKDEITKFAKIIAVGPYVNFTIEDENLIHETIKNILNSGTVISKTEEKTKILVETPSPNTNKPLHLGHLRNMLLGSSIANMLKAVGKEVHIVNIINDRGVHICKSMLAYKKENKGKTPQSEHMKPDHFVGHYYIEFNKMGNKSEAKEKILEEETQAMLLKWEEGDSETHKLWEQMNNWAYEGYEETFKKIGFKVDKNYYESEIYKGGKEIILKGLKEGYFSQDDTGAIFVDLTNKKLDKKILLRANGTSVYITQDINLAHIRHEEYGFDEMIYVVGNEQEYHFKVLFEIFKILGWSFGEKCKHFSYGMVELPEGKMKSREGKIIDTDDLVDQTTQLAYEAVKERFKELNEKETNQRAKIIALGAIKFFFLKNDPFKNFVFDPKASLSFEGETGPYIQYAHARICSILRKAKAESQISKHQSIHLSREGDKQIVKLMSKFQDVVVKAGKDLKPNQLCAYLIRLSQAFNNYYSKHQIIHDNKDLQTARLLLISAIKKILAEGLELLGIEAPEKM